MQNKAPRATSTAQDARRNARAELAYRNIRETGCVPGDPTMETFGVPSTSTPDVEYTVTHDMAHDLYHCNCPHGQNGKNGCVHELAAQRKVHQRRVDFEREQREGRGAYGYDDTYNLHYGTQASSDW